MRFLFLFATITLGCGGPAVYRLVDDAGGPVLIPPGVKSSQIAKRTVKARAEKCDPPADALAVERRGRHLRVDVRRAALDRIEAGALARWGVALEAAGCLQPGQGWVFAEQVARSVPLPMGAARQALTASERNDGYIDLRPGHRLRVAGPVFAEGAPPGATTFEQVGPTEAARPGSLSVTLQASEHVRGFELDWYGVESTPAGARIVPLSAERFVEGEPQNLDEPSSNPFVFDSSAAYFRLLFLARLELAPDHDILLLAAPTPAELEERYERIRARPSLCEQERGFCSAAPREVAFLPFITVSLNGEELRLPPGSAVRHALREAGFDAKLDPGAALAVEKPFQGRLAPVRSESSEIVELPLEGGERIVVGPR